MEKLKKILSISVPALLLLLVLILPAVSFAGLVPCTNSPGPDGTIKDPCDFNALMRMINIIIRYALFYLVIPIAAIMFFYAGFLLIVPGGESAHARERAKHIFWDAFIGLIIALAAWIIIKTLLSILGYDAGWIFDNFN